jgi:hypothetical protein
MSVFDWQADAWMLEGSLPPMKLADAEAWVSFFAGLRGRAALKALEIQGQKLAPAFEAAIRTGDKARLQKLIDEELIPLLRQMAELRMGLGEGAELLQSLREFSARYGVDLSSVLPGGPS